MNKHAELDDRDLVQHYLGGESWAFDALMQRHQHRVYRLALGMTGDHDRAADISQETFLRAFRALPGFDFRSSFGTWLHRIAVNLCLSQIRREKFRQFLSLDGMAQQLRSNLGRPSRDLADKELSRRIDAAIGDLPPRQRAIFLMHHQEEIPHTEIARILERSEGAVRASYFQALKKLRRRLKDDETIEP